MPMRQLCHIGEVSNKLSKPADAIIAAQRREIAEMKVLITELTNKPQARDAYCLYSREKIAYRGKHTIMEVVCQSLGKEHEV